MENPGFHTPPDPITLHLDPKWYDVGIVQEYKGFEIHAKHPDEPSWSLGGDYFERHFRFCVETGKGWYASIESIDYENSTATIKFEKYDE